MAPPRRAPRGWTRGPRLAGELPRPPASRRREHGPDADPPGAHRHRRHHHPRVVRVHLPDGDAVPVERAIPSRTPAPARPPPLPTATAAITTHGSYVSISPMAMPSQ